MSKAFTKGDAVTLLRSWDNKGTVTYTDAIVYSCGAKRMVITCAATGRELGRQFAPVRGSLDNVGSFNWQGVFPRMTEEQAVEACLEAGAKVVEAVRRNYAHRSDILANLHEPRAMARTVHAGGF